MNKLKIMHCLGRLDTGGAETLVINILRNLDKEKCKFDFLLFDEKKGFYDDEVKKLGSQLFYSPNIGSVGLKKYIEKMIEFFKAHDIDIVHSHMDWQGGFIAYAAYKAGIKKIVVHSHADQDMFAQNIIYTYMIKLNKYLIKKYATDLCACSKKAADIIIWKTRISNYN